MRFFSRRSVGLFLVFVPFACASSETPEDEANRGRSSNPKAVAGAAGSAGARKGTGGGSGAPGPGGALGVGTGGSAFGGGGETFGSGGSKTMGGSGKGGSTNVGGAGVGPAGMGGTGNASGTSGAGAPGTGGKGVAGAGAKGVAGSGGKACVPACGAVQCGPDPTCGQPCGSCSTGEVCNAARVCQPTCVPACGSRTCGLDPICGTSCGNCAGSATCSTQGQCVVVCKPDCAGRICGVDPVCGTTCGVCAGGTSCSAGGQCEVPCTPTWTTQVAGVTGVGQPRIDAGGKIYVAGAKSNGAWVGAFAACDGALTKEKLIAPPWANRTSLLGLTLAGGVIHAVGQVATQDDPGNGYYVRLDQSLEVLGDQPLFGSTVSDVLFGVGVLPSGTALMVGSVNLAEGVPSSFWGVKVKPQNTGACGFPVFDGLGGGRAVLVIGSSLWMAGALGQDVVVARFADAACGADDPCGCKPEESVTLALGGAAEARAMVSVGGAIYIAGFVNLAGDTQSFIARVNASPLSIEPPAFFDPTTDFDAFLGLATDGTMLYAVGAQGWKGELPLQTSTALVAAYPLDLSATSVPLWTKTHANVRSWMAADGAPGVGAVVSGTNNTSLTLMRCSASGCP